MNLLNRVLVIAQLLVAIAMMPILIVALLFLRSDFAKAVGNVGSGLDSGPNAAVVQALCVGLAAFAFVVAILLLFLELQKPSIRRLRVQQVTDGQVEVTADAITHRVEHSVLQIADVIKAKPRVIAAGKGGAVDLFLELETGPEVNVPQKTQEVIAVAKQVLGEQMGLQVGKIQVQVNHAQKQKKAV